MVNISVFYLLLKISAQCNWSLTYHWETGLILKSPFYFHAHANGPKPESQWDTGDGLRNKQVAHCSQLMLYLVLSHGSLQINWGSSSYQDTEKSGLGISRVCLRHTQFLQYSNNNGVCSHSQYQNTIAIFNTNFMVSLINLNVTSTKTNFRPQF